MSGAFLVSTDILAVRCEYGANMGVGLNYSTVIQIRNQLIQSVLTTNYYLDRPVPVSQVTYWDWSALSL